MIKIETETGEIMRYLGSKIKLLSSIDEVIKENNIEGETFADLFAGTGCVGDFFKDRYQIISNDFLFYSYVMNRAKLKNDSIPKFDCFRKKYKSDIFEWLNTQTYIPDDSYFIYLNYTGKSLVLQEAFPCFSLHKIPRSISLQRTEFSFR